MPAYAAWLEELWAATANRRQPPIDPHRVIVVADHLPSPAKLSECLGGSPALIMAPMKPVDPVPGMAYATFRTATNPIEWGAEADQAVAAGADTVAFLLPEDEVHGRTLLHLWRLGLKRCLLWKNGAIYAIHPVLAAGRKKLHAMSRHWLTHRAASIADGRMPMEHCRRYLAPIATGRRSRLIPAT